MKVLFDTNILLDVFIERHPFYKDAVKLLSAAEQDRLEGYLGATTVTTIHYLLSKTLNKKAAHRHLESLFKIFHIAPVNTAVLTDAMKLDFDDYEDAVLCQSAVQAGLDGIVTRNQKDFRKSPIPVFSPEELVAVLELRD